MKDTGLTSAIARSDYLPSNYLVHKVGLLFDLFDECARVRSSLHVAMNEISNDKSRVFSLDGKDLKLLALTRDGVVLRKGTDYTLDADHLLIHDMPDQCLIVIDTEIYPAKNTALEGLYQSSGNFCTQCEAEGFRRITFFPDRPDVMACYEVKIISDKKYPILLSNGNEVGRGELEGNRHWVQWLDPHPKPSYLFALVAGDLGVVKDQFVTASGRHVDLCIYVEHHNLGKCDHVMVSLKRAMRWDEEVYGLEYDLDIYMIVAVDDFNMGAMENKGLNVFNSKYVLADRLTATDVDFQGIEAVIAHEYFHNWTGNRVTCRDWFQLSLKEGLTVFRDQEFSADLNSRAVKRIEDIRLLRARQFPEDAGPMSHPIRPDSYIEINNFYTVTIYEKGAEVIRMMHTLMGPQKFREGIDLYFSRHDGQAVTCEDFVSAMEAASGVDLRQFRHWYSQAGTPVLTVNSHYDQSLQQYRLTIEQFCPPTPGQPHKEVFHLPLSVALLDSDGLPMPLNLDANANHGPVEITLDVLQAKNEFTFHQVAERPVPSLLRGFSAPVLLDYNYNNEELAFLLANDDDSFNRWESGQLLVSRRIEQLASDQQDDDALDALIFQGFKKLLSDPAVDAALKAKALQLPTIEMIAERRDVFDIDSLNQAHKNWQRKLISALKSTLASCLTESESLVEVTEFAMDSDSVGRRALHNRCLGLLVQSSDLRWSEAAQSQFHRATNMTDQLAALAALIDCGGEQAKAAVAYFYTQWQSEKLVIDKWFAIQAMADSPETIANVRQLMTHRDFDIKNPNRVRSLVGVFSMSNPVQFHAAGGQGYELLTETIVRLDDINPQVAARLVNPLIRWRRFDDSRQKKLQKCLKKIAAKPGLSNDVYEIVSKALA